jgi:16S rRNA (cytidine1402-2'-O)-methyltransferase
MSATLAVVGTPIGNLGDITERAREILSSVDLVLCEDTRVTRNLLKHIGSSVKMISIHHHSTDEAMRRVLQQVADGASAAYVSDAGTPGISDPGGKLVAMAYEMGITVLGIPGPSAVTTALSMSGFPADRFLFLGFLPHKKGRETLYQRIADAEETVVLYESPHRILRTLTSLSGMIPNKQVAVCRELTKIHESVVRGSFAEAIKHFTDHPDQVRGEVVLVISAQ